MLRYGSDSIDVNAGFGLLEMKGGSKFVAIRFFSVLIRWCEQTIHRLRKALCCCILFLILYSII